MVTTITSIPSSNLDCQTKNCPDTATHELASFSENGTELLHKLTVCHPCGEAIENLAKKFSS